MPYSTEDRPSSSGTQSGSTQPDHDSGVLLYRRSDGYAPFFRSDRYFTVGHEWYVTKREGGHLGPYLSQEEAQRALAKHVAVVLDLSGEAGRLLDPQQGGPATAFEGMVRSVLERWKSCAPHSEGDGDGPPAEETAGVEVKSQAN